MKPTLDQLRAVGDFATSYSWYLSFIKLPAALPFAISSDDINIRCESSTIPKMSGESIEVKIRGLKVKQPGIYTPEGTLELKLVETVDNSISKLIQGWREICWQNKTGVQLLKSLVEAEIRLVRLDRMGNEIFEYRLVGVYLEEYDPGGELGTEGEIIKPSMTLSYDYFEDLALA